MSDQADSPLPFPETERQAAEMQAFRRMLAASKGTFSFSVATCNSPALRDHLISRLCDEDPQIAVVPLPKGVRDVLDAARASAADRRPSALFLTGLEASLPSTEKRFPVLRALNASRELWQDSFPCPVVLWLPEYATTLLSRHAPDLWSWRSHQFEFVSEMATAHEALADSYAGNITAASNLDADQKRFRIAELEQRIADAGDPPPDQLVAHVLMWLNELGCLHQMIGDLDSAEQVHCKALEISEKSGRLEGMAEQYGNLGLIHFARGELDRSEELQRKALEVCEKLGRLEGIGNVWNNLGLIYRYRGDLHHAEEFHRKALEIFEKLRRLEGMATAYGNLGLIYDKRGDLDHAEEFHRRNLQISEKLDWVESMANAYGNLGLIYDKRGDLKRAEESHRRALELFEKLGRLEGMATAYVNLGSIYEQRGDPDQARVLWHQARDLYGRLGARHMVRKMDEWLAGLDRATDAHEGP